MNTAPKIHTPSVIDPLVSVLEDNDLSSSEKVVLCRLRLFVGYDKYKRISVKKIGEKCKFCESRTREILSSLVFKGRLIRIIQRGRTNLWAFPDQACRKTPTEVRPHLRPSLNTNNVNRKNVFSKNNGPKKKPFDMSLVLEIEKACGTNRDRGCWITIARECLPDIVHGALSALRIAQQEQPIAKPGAYIVGIIKQHYPDLFAKKDEANTPKTSPVSHSKPNERSITHANKATAPVPLVKKTPLEPVIEPKPDYDTGLSAIAKIKAMLEAKLSIEARERQREAGEKFGRGMNQDEKVGQKVAQAIDKPDERSAVKAARLTGTNKQYVKDAKKIAAENPDVLLGWEVKHDPL